MWIHIRAGDVWRNSNTPEMHVFFTFHQILILEADVYGCISFTLKMKQLGMKVKRV